MQTFLAQKATNYLSEKMETVVTVDKVSVVFFDQVRLEGVYMEDLSRDTMIYASEIEVDIDALRILKQEVMISEVELIDAKFYMRRRKIDEKFNLSLFSKLADPDKEEKDSKPWNIGISRLKLDNARYKLIDSLNMTFLTVSSPRLDFTFNEVSIEKGLVDIASADLREPVTKIVIQERWRIDSSAVLSDIDTNHILPKGLEIRYANVCMDNGYFSLRNYRGGDTTSKGIDFNDLEVTGIQLDVSDGGLLRDTIFTDIEYLAGREKSGLEIISLSSKTRVSTVDITCDSLYLKTAESEISDYLKFTYRGFRSFASFVDDVKMEGNFDRSVVSMRDINYFAKALDIVEHNDIKINGQITGTISNLRGRDLELKAGNQTSFTGKFNLIGLPNIKETFISFNCESLKTNYNDLMKITPGIPYPENLASLGQINFNGHFDGFINNFVTYGMMKTSIGTITTDINLELLSTADKAAYSGALSMDNFDLGQFTGDEKNLGRVSLAGTLKGKGFDVEHVNAALDAEVQSFVFKDFNYENVLVDGKFDQREFNGELEIDMEDISFVANGLADFNDTLPKLNFKADIRRAHLQNLNILSVPIQVSTSVQVDFIGNSVDNAISYIQVDQLELIRELDTFNTEGIELTTTVIDSNRTVSLTSEFMEGQMKGNYRFMTLLPSLKYFFGEKEPEIFGTAEKPEREQQFELDFVIYQPGNLTKIIDPNFKVLRNTKVYCGYDSRKSNLTVEASIPEFVFGDIGLVRNRVSLDAKEKTGIDLSFLVDKVTIKDSAKVDSILFEANLLDHQLEYRFQLQPKDTVNSLDLNGKVKWEEEFYSMVMDTRSLLINTQKWAMDNSNKISFLTNGLAVSDVKIFSESQSIAINSENVHPDSIVNLDLEFENLNLEDFSQLIKLGEITLTGLVDGSVQLLDVFSSPSITGDVSIQTLTINKDTVGDIEFHAKLNNQAKRIDLNGNVIGKHNELVLQGSYPLTADSDGLNINGYIERVDLSILNTLLPAFVYDVDGKANGTVSLTGSIQKPNLTGYLKLRKAEATVQYLHTHYMVEDGQVNLNAGEIDLTGLELTDIYGNKANATGRIVHDYLRDWRLDLSVASNNFQFVNTNFELNPDYFGEVIAAGSAKFSGPFKDIKIEVKAKSLPGTDVALVVDETGDVGEYKFLNFVDMDAEESEPEIIEKKKGTLEVFLDLEITPDAQITLIMDLDAGDRLVATGSGNIQLKVDKNLNVGIFGSFTIESGDYLFTLQNVINKKFVINKGSNIIFNGDPYQAIIDVGAEYTRSASVYNLIAEYLVDGQDEEEISKAQNRTTYNISFKLRGVLSKPNIEFDIEMPDLDPSIRTTVENKLALLRNNQNELNKQVFGLLVMGQFLPSGTGSASANNPNLLAQGIGNTISEFLSTQLSYYLSDALSAFGSGITIDIDYRQYGDFGTSATEGSAQVRQAMNIALQEEFFDDRITVRVGGGFDVGTNYETQKNQTTFIGDIQIEYSITADGRIRIKAFSKTDYDVWTSGNQNRTGAGITFREEFDTGKDLFSNIKKKKREKKRKNAEETEALLQEEINPIDE